MDYAGHRVIGHHGGVKGYRSMIMFDPALKSGVVVLWNSSSSRPNGIEYEVMDMIYHLPFRDWLGLRRRRPARRRRERQAAEAANEGGGVRHRGEGRGSVETRRAFRLGYGSRLMTACTAGLRSAQIGR